MVEKVRTCKEYRSDKVIRDIRDNILLKKMVIKLCLTTKSKI